MAPASKTQTKLRMNGKPTVSPPTPSKRKAAASPQDAKEENAVSPTRKKPRKEPSGKPVEEEYNIVDRRFYPPQMSLERCAAYTNGQIPRPSKVLAETLAEASKERSAVAVKDAIVHYFKVDIRLQDNRGLHLASEKARSKDVPLIGVYLISPQDFEAHVTAPVRVDFILRNLKVLREDLEKLNIPLYVEIVPVRKHLPSRLLDLCQEWGAAHLYANVEYEVDELRRETKLVREGLKRGIDVTAVHDTCAVAPGRLSSGSGNQFSVYSPWYRAWMKYLHEHPDDLNPYPSPKKNPASARKKFAKLFESTIPDASKEESLKGKALTDEEKERFLHLWPAGEHEAQDRLQKFLQERVTKYADTRNLPAADGTAKLSPHFAVGSISSRTAIRAAQARNSSKKLDAGNKGIVSWISEVAWRDFYKHVLAHWPYICMNVPFKPEYNNIEWDYDQDKLDAWAQGRTGFPIVDAAMRQMRQTAYVHNRCRMIVASFLCKDLLQDWRMGERHFMNNLIDADFASNNGGWGFSASCGVDPQPYFRIFNPLLQSEKFDPTGEYIRKWVPELKDVQGNAIHDPWGRGAAQTAKNNGYPEPIVVHKDARVKALAMYKSGLKRETA